MSGEDTAPDRRDAARLLRSLEELAARAMADPASMVVRPSVSTRLEEGTRAVAEFEQHGEVHRYGCDEAEHLGGLGGRPSPLRYFLMGVAFCHQVWWAKAASMHGLVLTDLRVDVATLLDMSGEHRVAGPVHPQGIDLDIRVVTPGPDALVLAVADEAAARCPLRPLLELAVPVLERISSGDRILRERRTGPEGPEGRAAGR